MWCRVIQSQKISMNCRFFDLSRQLKTLKQFAKALLRLVETRAEYRSIQIIRHLDGIAFGFDQICAKNHPPRRFRCVVVNHSLILPEVNNKTTQKDALVIVGYTLRYSV